MNPMLVEQMFRAESAQRARKYAEIQLLNQAYPRGSNERQKRLSGSVNDAARRVRAWLVAVRAGGTNGADSAQPVSEPGPAR
jgi:hypothetical protein